MEKLTVSAKMAKTKDMVEVTMEMANWKKEFLVGLKRKPNRPDLGSLTRQPVELEVRADSEGVYVTVMLRQHWIVLEEDMPHYWARMGQGVDIAMLDEEVERLLRACG